MSIEQAIRDEVRAAITAELPALFQQWLERHTPQPPAEPRLIGTTDLLELLGISRNQLPTFIARHRDFPRPLTDGKSRKRWSQSAVADWIQQQQFNHAQPTAQRRNAHVTTTNP